MTWDKVMDSQLRLIVDGNGDVSIREVMFDGNGEAVACGSEPYKFSPCSKFELVQRLKLALDLVQNSAPLPESLF